MLADGDYRRSFIPRGMRTDQDRRRALGLDARAQPAGQQGKPQWQDLSDQQLDALEAKLEAERSRRLGVDGYLRETPGEREEREQAAAEALEEADLEAFQADPDAWDTENEFGGEAA
jgi:hypothetical protein